MLDQIAKKYIFGIANVATRFILDKPCIAGAIIGARLGIAEHRACNVKVFSFSLDDKDYAKITAVTSKANELFESIGDCGDEYR